MKVTFTDLYPQVVLEFNLVCQSGNFGKVKVSYMASIWLFGVQNSFLMVFFFNLRPQTQRKLQICGQKYGQL